MMKAFFLLFFALAPLSLAGPVEFFPLSRVQLGDGVFKESMETNLRVLDEIGTERALYAFRVNAGLPTGDAKALGGWGAPEPSGAFPGFYESHFLSALSLSYAQSGDEKLRQEVNHMVAELAKCQTALGGKFLFASPEAEFAPDRLDGVAWYRMHKLLEGLLAAYEAAGNEQALEVLKNLAGWIDTRMTSYGTDLEKVKKTEYGGMTEALEKLYAITKNPRHREMAHQWEEKEKILDRFHADKDYTEHANTLLAKLVGVARIAEVENSQYHRETAGNFWDLVVGSGRKTYATGGTSVHEGMPPVGVLAGSQAKMPQETCVSYNLLKVTESLYRLDGKAKYMDYYERCLFNSILGSQDPETGWKSYYQPPNANAVKDFRSPLTGCYCCNGTGLENASKYGRAIYAHTADSLRVNLFIASTLDWREKGIRLVQSTRFPAEQSTRLRLEMDKPVETEIAVRVPPWCGEKFSLRVNGKATKARIKGGFARLRREWQNGDEIAVALPFSFSKYRMPDKKSQLAFLYGPIVLVGEGARPQLGELVGDPDDLASWFKPVAGKPLHFTATDGAGREIRFKPYYEVGGGEFFTGYWNVVEKAAPTGRKNLALGKKTRSSTPHPSGANVEAFLRAAKAVDGQYGGATDFYTKWFPNGIAPQWLVVDLGQTQQVTGTEWFPAAEDVESDTVYRYKIEFSDDGKGWKIYHDRSENKEARASYARDRSVRARFFKLTVLPVPGLEGNQARPKIAEFKIFGGKST